MEIRYHSHRIECLNQSKSSALLRRSIRAAVDEEAMRVSSHDLDERNKVGATLVKSVSGRT